METANSSNRGSSETVPARRLKASVEEMRTMQESCADEFKKIEKKIGEVNNLRNCCWPIY